MNEEMQYALCVVNTILRDNAAITDVCGEGSPFALSAKTICDLNAIAEHAKARLDAIGQF